MSQNHSSFIFRPYQVAGIDQTLHALVSTGRAVMAAPTGSGKTAMGVAIAQRVKAGGGRTLYLVPRAEIFEQTRKRILEVEPNKATLLPMNAAGIAFPKAHHAIVLAMAQTLQRRIERWPLGVDPDLIIVDECHYGPEFADMVAKKWPNAALLGMSATPTRLADDRLVELYGQAVSVASTGELIAAGYLVPYHLHAGQTPDTKTLHVRGDGEFDQEEQEREFTSKRLMGSLRSALGAFGRGRTSIAFAASVKHSLQIVATARELGLRWEHLDATVPAGTRTDTLKALEQGKIDGISNVKLFIEGLDIPRIDCIFIAHATMSRGRFFQEIGRGLRPFPGKTDCRIVDFGDNWRRLGLPDDDDHVWDLKAQELRERPADFGVCHRCGRVCAATRKTCPGCLVTFKRRAGDVVHAPAEFVPIVTPQMLERAKMQELSRATAPRPCPPQYLRVSAVWHEAEGVRQRRGLALPQRNAPIGYSEHQCDLALQPKRRTR